VGCCQGAVRHPLRGPLRHHLINAVPHKISDSLEIRAVLRGRGLDISERSATDLLDRYDELPATGLAGAQRPRRLLRPQGGVVLALDGLQPDVGHEVLRVARDRLSGAVLLARSLLSARGEDLEPLLCEVAAAVGVPVPGVVSDGQTSIRRAVERALPGVPHRLCRFHLLREAAHPVSEADRHAEVACSRRGCGACARSSGASRGATTRRRRWRGATARPCAAPSPATAARRSPPRG